MDNDRRWLAAPICALAMGVVALLVVPVAAQQRPCEDDIKKLCPEAKPGTPEVRQCLKDNLDKLSEPCRQRINAAVRQRKGYPARFRGCEADLDKLCKETVPGSGRLIKCLREHESELSAECKARLPGGGAGGRGRGNGGGGGGKGGDGSGRGSGAAPTQPTAQAK